MNELEASKWLQTLVGLSIYIGYYGITLNMRGVEVYGESFINVAIQAKESGWDRYERF